MTTININKLLLEQVQDLLYQVTRWKGENHEVLTDLHDIKEAVKAVLAAPATAPDLSAAYIGAREDLAIWKKRALEAEETARQLTRALAEEVNGPTFMGEPVIAPQPERKPHTEAEVQEIMRDDWNLSQDKLETTVRRILGVPKP